MGKKYTNGIIEGFLSGRAEAAWRAATTEPNGTAARMWALAAAAYSQALDEYNANGDSELVRNLTDIAMSAGDDAIGAA